MNGEPHTIVIVEDDDALREAIGELIGSSGHWKLVANFRDAEEALEAIPTLSPRVVLMDIQLPGMSGIECVARLMESSPSLLVMMVTVYDNNDRIFDALAAGASGYLLKRDVTKKLLESLDELLAGGSPMSGVIARKVVKHFKKEPVPLEVDVKLTPRESEILDLLVKGHLYKEIAEECGIGVETVSSHLQNVYKKLHVRTRTEAVVKYLGWR